MCALFTRGVIRETLTTIVLYLFYLLLSKVFERHINVHLQVYLESNSIISKLQSGFRVGFSCTDAIHKIYGDCSRWKSLGYHISLIFLDFKKAFDCVDHSQL